MRVLIYIRCRTTTDDEAVQIQQELRVANGTTATTDGIVTVNKSVNIGVDADLEDGIILDTITDRVIRVVGLEPMLINQQWPMDLMYSTF